MWLTADQTLIQSSEAYTGIDGTRYPANFPKSEIAELYFITLTDKPIITQYQDASYSIVDMAQTWAITDWTPEQISQYVTSAKSLKWEAIKSERDTRITCSGVLVDGVWYHSDLQFRSVITQACRLFAIDEAPDDNPVKIAISQQLSEVRGKPWKTMSNTFVTPTHLLAIKIDAAHAVLTQGCHYQAEIHKAAMEASAYPSAYDFSTGWPATFTA